VSDQLNAWEGKFGEAYTDRNVVDWRTRIPAFREMVGGLEISQVLEIGCNRGHNLVALEEILGNNVDLVGIEPNPHALKIVRTENSKLDAIKGDIFDIPFKDGYFDFVFTACVLIHIDKSELPKALSEIYRVSSRYILAVEYFAEEETTIHYRGHDDLLWKRNFLKHYQKQFPGLLLVRSGYWGPEDGFDRTNWWLLEK
tara:strand:- start:2663 stop:3259 length:597 start_codon:yes stop_codon:yes gene_type:complete